MKTIAIKDLSLTTDLDTAAMTAVRGGTGYGYCMPSYSFCQPSGWSGPSFDINKNDLNFNASQQLGQSQNTQVNNGNNVAFASGITSNVTPTQNGQNTINFG